MSGRHTRPRGGHQVAVAVLIIAATAASGLGEDMLLRAALAAGTLVLGLGLHALWGSRPAPAPNAGWVVTGIMLGLLFLFVPGPWRPAFALLPAAMAMAAKVPRGPGLLIAATAALVGWQSPGAWRAAGEAGMIWAIASMTFATAAGIIERDRLITPVAGPVPASWTALRCAVVAGLSAIVALLLRTDALDGVAAAAGGGAGGRLLWLGVALVLVIAALVLARRPGQAMAEQG